jgi:predicted GIY-YIG superfamily endonuclease
VATTAATHAAQTAVYRLFNAKGALLYVGIARNPAERMKFHQQFKKWWAEVSCTAEEWFDNRALALGAEAVAIRQESPLYNIQETGEDGVIRVRKDLPPIAVGHTKEWRGYIVSGRA